MLVKKVKCFRIVHSIVANELLSFLCDLCFNSSLSALVIEFLQNHATNHTLKGVILALLFRRQSLTGEQNLKESFSPLISNLIENNNSEKCEKSI